MLTIPDLALLNGWINSASTVLRYPHRTAFVRRTNGRKRPDVRTPFGQASDAQLIKALEEHVATLKEQLAAAEVPAAMSCAFQGRRAFTASSHRRTSDQAPEHAWLCEATPRPAQAHRSARGRAG
jgi:hypothetical protein